MGIAQEIVQKQQSLESDRSSFEAHWAEVAPLVFPRQDDFFKKQAQQGEKRTREKFDDTATLALDHGAAAIEGVVTPRGQMWHGIGLPEAIEEDQESLEWADRLTRFLFKKRYSSEGNFASQIHECYMSLLAFGTCALIVEDMYDGTIRYKSSHIAEHYIQENIRGRVDTDYRKYRLTATQAYEKFKENTPEIVVRSLDREPSKKFEFIHAVIPNNDKWDSFHVFPDTGALLGRGEFKSFPYIISRWATSPNEIYGRSPAMTVLSEIKMLNSMRKTEIKARHMAVDQPILASDQATIRKFTLKPGAINYGTLDANGNPLVRPYMDGNNINVSNDGLEQSREFINRAFFLNLFQILVDAPQMTATEVLQRAQEKGQLLTPTAGRQMSELLEPIIMREIDIYERYGIFEDGGFLQLPDAVKSVGGEFSVKYTNPLSRMQLAEQAVGVERTIQSLLPLAQFDPSILERIDFKEYADILREANGAPAKIFKTDEEMQALEDAKAQAAQQQQLLEATPIAATAIKDIAQAGSYANG